MAQVNHTIHSTQQRTNGTLSQYANVSIYLDGAHAAWLGWPDNLGPTADILAEIVNRAKVINPAAAVRGVATNVSNYNGLGTSTNYGYDELDYVRNLAPLLTVSPRERSNLLLLLTEVIVGARASRPLHRRPRSFRTTGLPAKWRRLVQQQGTSSAASKPSP